MQTCKPSEIKPRYYVGLEEFNRAGTEDEENMLAGSILNRGILHPIIVDQHMNLVSGSRRLAAANRLGLKKVPFIIGDFYTVIRAMEDEQLAEKVRENHHVLPMTILEKLKMVLVLREVGKPIALQARVNGGKNKGKNKTVSEGPPATIEDHIQRVAQLTPASAYRVIRRLIIPAFNLSPTDGYYRIRTPVNQMAALKALEAYENGQIGSASVWQMYVSLVSPKPPQPMKLWEGTISAIKQHLGNLGPLMQQLETPPTELTAEAAQQWGNDISALMTPLRSFVNELRNLNTDKGEDN